MREVIVPEPELHAEVFPKGPQDAADDKQENIPLLIPENYGDHHDDRVDDDNAPGDSRIKKIRSTDCEAFQVPYRLQGPV